MEENEKKIVEKLREKETRALQGEKERAIRVEAVNKLMASGYCSPSVR